MKAAVAVTILTAAGLVACGSPTLLAPGWCPSPSYGGAPAGTPDAEHVLCIWAANKSDLDMGLTETMDGADSWALVQACSSYQASGPSPTTSWSLEVGRANNGENTGPVLARVDLSQLSGGPPYLIEVVINPDLTASIRQRSSLPWSLDDSPC